MEFRHFIITRFNVNIEPTDFPLRLDKAWLSLRFDLFQRFCFPSVRAQNLQDFTWLVLFDEKTPEAYARLISSYARYGNLEPLFCGDFETIMPALATRIRELSNGADRVLTTRLDNDDALENNFTAVLHSVVENLAAQEEPLPGALYLNLMNGLQHMDGKIYDFKDPTNAFVSLLETMDEINTVYWVDHPAIYKKAPVKQVETRPLWLQNVHGTNVYNYLRGEYIGQVEDLKNFTLQL